MLMKTAGSAYFECPERASSGCHRSFEMVQAEVVIDLAEDVILVPAETIQNQSLVRYL